MPALDPMPEAEKATFRDVYLAYLRRRDGTPDLATRRFDIRERFFADVDATPRRWTGKLPVDPEVFARNHARRRPEPGLDPATLWALATAKTNRAERFGVELALDNPRRVADLLEDPHTYIQIEEFYHTRILKDVLATIGLDVHVATPHPRTRLLVRAMVHLPEGISNVAVLAGEIVGVSIFTLLLEKARELFASQPAALSRIEALFAQILVDEVGHVHYLRSRLSNAQIAWTRRLLPLTLATLLDDIPELGQLLGRDTLIRHAHAADVDASAAPYADRLVFAA